MTGKANPTHTKDQPSSGTPPVWVLDDELHDRLIELTDGAVGPCFQCGVCTAVCPWGMVRGEPLSVRSLIRRAQVGFYDAQDTLWLCTACGACETRCPRGVPIIDVLRALRSLLWERREVLEGLPSVLWSEHWNNNPLFQPPSQRRDWAKGLAIPEFSGEDHELLLYVGCTPAYDRRAQLVARALVQLLRQAEVEFGILGEEEPCCGEAVLSLGHKLYFAEMASSAAGVFQQKRVGDLVCISPHCQEVFQTRYPECGSAFNPFHYTDYLAKLVTQGRLNLSGEFTNKVTMHDPCVLARREGTCDSIRDLLGSVSGLELLEMPHIKSETLCCGGGGGRMWMETPSNQRFADLRIREAVETGAEILATACPYCIACMEDSVKSMGLKNLVVMDVAEILVLALAG